MQFNPACLSGPPINSTNVSCNSTGQQQQSEFINNIQSYTDTSSTNGWSNPIINSLPLYGIFNSSNLVPVPQDASQPQQSSDANAKKKSAKRTPPTTVKGDDLSPTEIGGEDKSQGLDEEQKQKRQRRLLKNREAAQQFRQRQKEYIQNLERKVGELTGLVGESHKHIELLNTENRLLRDQLVYLYNVMRQNLSLTASPTASPSLNPQPLITSPIPSVPNPAGMIDLSMLGFKGFDANTSFEEMLKSNPNPAPMQLLVPPPLTHLTSPAMTPNHSPSPSPMVSPMISPRIPDMGNLSLAKGLEMDALMCEGMNNPMFMARYGGYMKTGNNGNNGNNSNNGGGGGDHNNEPQTVPELIIKAEGGSGNM